MSDEVGNIPVVARYACMPRARISEGDLAVEAVQPRHIERIRQWRNAQMDVLRQSHRISAAEQEGYYRQHVWPILSASHPSDIVLSYHDRDELVGYGGLVHIAWMHRRAEVSFLLDSAHVTDAGRYEKYFAAFLRLISTLAFTDLGIQRLFTETYAHREAHIAILEKSGFQREGTLRKHVYVSGKPVDSLIHGRMADAGVSA